MQKTEPQLGAAVRSQSMAYGMGCAPDTPAGSQELVHSGEGCERSGCQVTNASQVEKRIQSSDFSAISPELGPQKGRELFGFMERSWKLGVQGYILPFLQSFLLWGLGGVSLNTALCWSDETTTLAFLHFQEPHC